jgi:hypothetical protein
MLEDLNTTYKGTGAIICMPFIRISYFAKAYFFYATLCCLMLSACAPLIGPYSPTAYINATSLKPQTLALMEKASEPYQIHKATIESHTVELKKAYEYVKGVPSNSISAKQWHKLIDGSGYLYGKFIKRWKEQSTLSDLYITEFKKVIADAFDEIICLEANKKEAFKCRPNDGE